MCHCPPDVPKLSTALPKHTVPSDMCHCSPRRSEAFHSFILAISPLWCLQTSPQHPPGLLWLRPAFHSFVLVSSPLYWLPTFLPTPPTIFTASLEACIPLLCPSVVMRQHSKCHTLCLALSELTLISPDSPKSSYSTHDSLRVFRRFPRFTRSTRFTRKSLVPFESFPNDISTPVLSFLELFLSAWRSAVLSCKV